MKLSDFPPRTTINDRYVLSRRLGSGSGGAVYEAYDRHLDTQAAVKLLQPLEADAAGPWHEAQLLERLKSRFLLPVINADVVTDSDIRFIVTPVIGGGDLSRLAEPYGLAGSAAAHLVQQVASGLDRIHRADMVHRDVKPENILVAGSDAVLGDLGFCHLLDEHGYAPPNGTYCTVAPEVLEDSGKCSPASDVYSLAATAFYLLSGEYPVDHRLHKEEQRAQLIAGAGRELRTLAPHVSRAVGAVVRKSLRRDPEMRHASVTEFGNALVGATMGCRDWQRVTHGGHLHCIDGAPHGAKKNVRICCNEFDGRTVAVRARMVDSGRRIPGVQDIVVTPRRLTTTLQQLTATL